MMKSDFQKDDKNSLLSSALASMSFDKSVHIVVLERVPGVGFVYMGGGYSSSVIKRFGRLLVESSCITPDGLLRIIVKSPDVTQD